MEPGGGVGDMKASGTASHESTAACRHVLMMIQGDRLCSRPCSSHSHVPLRRLPMFPTMFVTQSCSTPNADYSVIRDKLASCVPREHSADWILESGKPSSRTAGEAGSDKCFDKSKPSPSPGILREFKSRLGTRVDACPSSRTPRKVVADSVSERSRPSPGVLGERTADL